jgi:uncharacterized Ntn-hydrolase superfamily protein
MTFSIIGWCCDTGMFGVAVSSSSPAVAARCAYAQAGVGAMASQNITDPTLGTRGLALMANGASAPETVEILRQTGAHIEYRQVTAVDAKGRTAIFSGANILGVHGESIGDGCVAAGNMLTSSEIPKTMTTAFETTPGHIGDRLMAAMEAARDAGGEEGPVHSIGMKIVREVPWPVADLRIDWTENDPIAELRTAWEVYKPQLDAYVTRALNPTDAPSYGVPGDE